MFNFLQPFYTTDTTYTKYIQQTGVYNLLLSRGKYRIDFYNVNNSIVIDGVTYSGDDNLIQDIIIPQDINATINVNTTPFYIMKYEPVTIEVDNGSLSDSVTETEDCGGLTYSLSHATDNMNISEHLTTNISQIFPVELINDTGGLLTDDIIVNSDLGALGRLMYNDDNGILFKNNSNITEQLPTENYD